MISKEGKVASGIDRRFWSDSGPEQIDLSRRYVQRIRHQIRQELNCGRPIFLIGQRTEPPITEKRIIFLLQRGRFSAYALGLPRRKSSFDGNYRLKIRQDNNQLLAQLKLTEQKLNFRILGVLGFPNRKLEILADLVPQEESIPQA